MSDYHNQIFQRHLIFMRELESIKSKLPSETYYALEGGFKGMCQLAEILADEGRRTCLTET